MFVEGKSSAIALFAHKGGVGKSTLAFDIGYKMQQKGRNIVIIDADPQMNSTFKILSRNGYNIDVKTVDAFLSQDIDQPITLVKRNVPKAFCSIYNYLSSQPVYTDTLIENTLIPVKDTDRMYLVAGSALLTKLDAQLLNAIFMGSQFPFLGNVPKLFKNLLDELKDYFHRKNENVTILIDVSPSTNILNQNILLSSDLIFLPVNADFHSYTGIRLLFQFLPQWKETHTYLRGHDVKVLGLALNRLRRKIIINGKKCFGNISFDQRNLLVNILR